MSLFSKNVVKNNKNSNVVIGDQNLQVVSQQLSEVREATLTNDSEDWGRVLVEIKSMQEVLRSLSDEHEELRDQQLIPSLSKIKSEAVKLKEEPSSEKKGFIDQFKSFADLSNTVVDVASKVAPYITTIAKLIGLPLP